MSELDELRQRLKRALSDHPPEGELSSGELSERIKALRASVTVEEAPAPQARASNAEVPVTRRIRKTPVVEAEPVEHVKEAETEPVAIKPIGLPEPVNSHRGEVVSRRQGSQSQMRLF